MDECLVMILVPEEALALLVDCLLDCPLVTLFTTMPVYGHGGGVGGLSAAEQVEGCEYQVLVRILTRRERMAVLLASLRQGLPGLRLRYWVEPVLESGEI
jgi:hypothetical protein